MHKLLFTAAALGLFASGAALPQPAMAQGTLEPIAKGEGNCPTGWSTKTGTSGTQCSTGGQRKAYYKGKGGQCASGYSTSYTYYCLENDTDTRSAADKLVSYGTITKANRLDRCPLGYFSKADMTICTTRLSPAPKSRKKSGPCNSNEIAEWDLWCTADANVITRAQAEMEATRDFNAIYSANGANYPAQGSDTEDYPSMVAAYGRKGGGASASAASSSSTSGEATPSASAQCTTSSASGAAVGGALAGEAGAVVGSLLGGLGKKKKKKEGC